MLKAIWEGIQLALAYTLAGLLIISVIYLICRLEQEVAKDNKAQRK